MTEITREQVSADLQSAGLQALMPEYLDLIRPAVRVRREPVEDEATRKGASKMGGCPDLPPGTGWPRLDGRPLAFLMQVALSDLRQCQPPLELPRSGLLSFFYDAVEQPWGYRPEDAGGGQVLWSTGVRDELIRHSFPNDLSSDARYSSLAVTGWEPVLTLPARRTDELWELIEKLDDESRERFHGLAEKWEAAEYDKRPNHQLLGNPNAIQGDMAVEAQLVSSGINCGGTEGYKSARAVELRAGARDWRLLLQIDTDNDAGWMWGDDGTVYCWVREHDLAVRRFERTWTVLQCY